MPDWSDSSSASSSSFSVNLSTTDFMIRTRSSGSMSAQTPESNDSRAAAIAACASSRPPFGTVATMSPDDGFSTSKVSPPAASTHSPPM